jgi:hypothetical protein
MTLQYDGLYPDCPTITRIIEVGGVSKAELLQQFQEHAISLNNYGKLLFEDDSWTPSKSACHLETVELIARQLGFPEGATSDELFERACELGLSLCPVEVGPFLRLQYLDQPQGFWITIASQKLSGDPEFPNGFYVRRLEDGLWLRGYIASDDHVWDADDHFVFCKIER